MRSQALAAAALAFGTSLAGCAATTTTSKTAVDYNRVFAESRNEVLVTNILRASAREPLQFSTIGAVQGGMRNTGSVKLAVPSIIGDGPTILSPEFTVNEGINPNVNIVPLGDKEFTEAMLKPVSPETINFFLNQGWDPELVLHLAIGGIECPNGAVVFNRGQPSVGNDGKPTGSRYDAFVRMLSDVPTFPIQPTGQAEERTVVLPAAAVVEFLKDGVGKLGRIKDLAAVEENKTLTEMVEVTIVRPRESKLVGLGTSQVCMGVPPPKPRLQPLQGGVEINDALGQPQGKALLRSVESMIYFLGETHRARWEGVEGCRARTEWPYYIRSRLYEGEPTARGINLFRLERACSNEPVEFATFLQTRFNGRHYYVLRQADSGRYERTLTTLTFLNELIALQTSGSAIASSTPVIAITTR